MQHGFEHRLTLVASKSEDPRQNWDKRRKLIDNTPFRSEIMDPTDRYLRGSMTTSLFHAAMTQAFNPRNPTKSDKI
jgi:hypothetical protein